MALFSATARIRRRQRRIHRSIRCAHYESELELITTATLDRRGVPGAVAEFGFYKGGSTAKLSLACAHVGKELHVFDSFEGLPEPESWDAEHRIERQRTFRGGEYAGAVEEVRANVARLGRIDVCTFHPGWFADTLAPFREPLAVAFVDVDLAASLREVLERIWTHVSPGGIVFVHDATDRKLQRVLADETLLAGAVAKHVPRRDDLPLLDSKTLAWMER
jgi:O-methyltransferase